MSDPRTLPLLLEIGCEEIPARFLARAQLDFGERLRMALEEARLLEAESGARSLASESASPNETRKSKLEARAEPELGVAHPAGNISKSELRTPNSQLKTYSTPRRLLAHIPALLECQPDKVEEITGPPIKVAFDKEGKPTRAAESFAAKSAIKIEDLYRVTTSKGEYLAARKTTLGQPALQVLGEILPGVITGINFPKSMYWEQTKTRWIRPIRWILAVWGEGSDARVIPLEVAGVKSGNVTRGARKFETGKSKLEIGSANFEFRISSFVQYAAELRQVGVEFDPAGRRALVQQRLKVSLEGSGFRVVPDQDLEEWIVNSTEWPHALVGSFDERFLKLPREILITVMRNHQHYFAVEDCEGDLKARFVTFLNVAGDPKGIIRHGHERVLTARFTDAEFFWDADQRVTLADRFKEGWLDRVTYHEKVGSYGDKVRRMEAIGQQVCFAMRPSGSLMQRETAEAIRAIQLCKCDLTTQMVQEFTELQGVVGGLYAAAQGERSEVAEAIYDHYKPQGIEDGCPRSLLGAVVSLADKLDSVVAGFAAGLEPTGSSDPFGLRRAGNGVVKILIEGSFPVLFAELLRNATEVAGLDGKAALLDSLEKFFDERVRFYLEHGKGLQYDTVRAVMAALPAWHGTGTLVDYFERGLALERIRDTGDFFVLIQAAKRIRNILTKSESEEDRQAVVNAPDLDPGDFALAAEIDLYKAYDSIWKLVSNGGMLSREYDKAFALIAGLRGPVDRFFDEVLIMDEDDAVRRRRLLLLHLLDERIFRRFADLAQIESSTSNVGAPT